MKSLKGLLIINHFLRTKKFEELKDMFFASAKTLEIEFTIITNAEAITFLYDDEKLRDYQFVLFWDKDVLLAKQLEEKGIPVFNSSEAIEICDHKGKTYVALLANHVPTPKTVCAPMTYENIGYTDYEFVEVIEKEFSYPMIVKEAYGSFGQQVYLMENKDELMKKFKELQGTSFIIQEFIKESIGKDLRLQVVSDKVVATMKRSSETDFRANITAGGTMSVFEPTCEMKELAVRAARACKADFAGVDLLFTKHGVTVCEVNSNAHFKNIYDCTGVDVSFEILKYIKNKLLD